MAVKSKAVPEKPLFASIKDIKQFLLWARTEGALSIEVAGVKAVFNPNFGAQGETPQMGLELVADSRTPEQIEADLKKEEEAILFHSVR